MESSRKLSEIKDLHDKIRQSAEEAKKKESLYKQLVRETKCCCKVKKNCLICLPVFTCLLHYY